MGEMTTPSSTECPLLLEHQPLIDALGYIDTQYNDTKAQQIVQHLIRAEMTKFVPSSKYLDFLPDYEPSFTNHPRLQNEYRRVKANVPLNAIDLNRYQVREPTGKLADDVEAWRAAVDKLQTQVEIQSNRLTNLELQQAYASKMWKARAAILDGLNSQYEHSLKGVKEASEQVNVTRKQAQALNAPKLESYKHKFDQLIQKNETIKRACEVAELRNSKRRKVNEEPTQE